MVDKIEGKRISSKGRYIWCEDPIKYTFDTGKLTVSSWTGRVLHGQADSDLASAYEYVSKTFFPTNGLIPDPAMFAVLQHNTWIELQYDLNEYRTTVPLLTNK